MLHAILFLIFFCFNCLPFELNNSDQPVCLFGDSPLEPAVVKMLGINNVIFHKVNSLKMDSQLYIIFGSSITQATKLPKFYIVYQDQDITKCEIQDWYIKALEKAIAIWDYSWDNISAYSHLWHYYFCPPEYEFSDPVILSCFLPTNHLHKYKELLMYSNQNASDICSHIPIIFCYGILQKPRCIIEAGVCLGQSTIAFKNVLNAYDTSRLIGIDVDSSCQRLYADICNGSFLAMSDLDFHNHLTSQNLSTSNFSDIIFIDTTHLYEHTLQEITMFVPMLSNIGMLIFHDTNLGPLEGNTYKCLNNRFLTAWNNERGVCRAIQEYFGIYYNEKNYCAFNFIKNAQRWKLIHYPFCNGLTILCKENL